MAELKAYESQDPRCDDELISWMLLQNKYLTTYMNCEERIEVAQELARRLQARNEQVAQLEAWGEADKKELNSAREEIEQLEAEKWQLRAQLALTRVKESPPFETFTNPWCKGSLALGSACGTCEKCEWEREQIRRAEEPSVPVSELEKLVERADGCYSDSGRSSEYDGGLRALITRAKGEHGPG